MLHAVIMAGGSGKRFWPQSRLQRPKQVLPIAGSRPMIVETVLRLDGLVSGDRTYIVTHESQVGPLLGCFGTSRAPHVIAEPYGRNTAACIGLAAMHIRKADADGTMLVMPADQVIQPTERFQEVMRVAVASVEQGDALLTFGIKPRYPATGYGYVHRGERVGGTSGIPIYKVRRFREKPARQVAEEFVASDEYYWNSGIFCWRVTTILDCLRRFTPKLYDALQRIGGSIATPNEAAVLREAYEPLERISIDYAVMERAEEIRVVEADFEWSDVGSWESVARLRRAEADEQGNVLIGRCEAVETSDSLIVTEGGHLVGVVGLEDVVVIHTPDATLVCSRRRAEDVKLLVDRLEKKGLREYL